MEAWLTTMRPCVDENNQEQAIHKGQDIRGRPVNGIPPEQKMGDMEMNALDSNSPELSSNEEEIQGDGDEGMEIDRSLGDNVRDRNDRQSSSS